MGKNKKETKVTDAPEAEQTDAPPPPPAGSRRALRELAQTRESPPPPAERPTFDLVESELRIAFSGVVRGSTQALELAVNHLRPLWPAASDRALGTVDDHGAEPKTTDSGTDEPTT